MLSSSKSQILPRPFLKWAGGKSRLIPQYSEFFPPEKFTTYYEPFLGGGAVFFHLRQHSSFKAVLTDINPELINAYCCVRDLVEELIEILATHQRKHHEYPEKYYYKIRSTRYDTKIERAARLIYLNKTCFNGLYRENSRGEFNVPMGRYKNPLICQVDLLRDCSEALQNVTLEVRKFDEILEYSPTPQDFVYLDPPYYPLSSTSDFTAYSRDSFKEAEQIKLRDVFAQLANQGVKVMLSNSYCSFIAKIYYQSQFFNNYLLPKFYKIEASRAINSDPAKRGKILEYLILSY